MSRCRLGAQRGSTAIEVAVLVPAVLAVIFVAFQAAWWFYAKSLAIAAAEEGMHVARAYTANVSSGSSAAQAYLRRTAGDALTDVSVNATSTGSTVRVRVEGRGMSLIPGLSGFPITAEAVGPKERIIR